MRIGPLYAPERTGKTKIRAAAFVPVHDFRLDSVLPIQLVNYRTHIDLEALADEKRFLVDIAQVASYGLF